MKNRLLLFVLIMAHFSLFGSAELPKDKTVAPKANSFLNLICATGAFIARAPVALAFGTAYSIYSQQQKEKDEGILPQVKDFVKKNGLSYHDWKTGSNNNQLIKGTNCATTSQLILHNLMHCKEADFRHYAKHSTVSTDKEFRGNISDFILRQQPLKTTMLNTSDYKSLLFLVVVGNENENYYNKELLDAMPLSHDTSLAQYNERNKNKVPNHVYIIEKIATPSTEKWRIYQSHHNQFSIAQWLGIDKWRRKKWHQNAAYQSGKTAKFDAFGSGKRINQAKLLDFIYQVRNSDDNRLYVRMFDISDR